MSVLSAKTHTQKKKNPDIGKQINITRNVSFECFSFTYVPNIFDGETKQPYKKTCILSVFEIVT